MRRRGGTSIMFPKRNLDSVPDTDSSNTRTQRREKMGGSREGSVGSYSSGSGHHVDVTAKYGTQETHAKISKVFVRLPNECTRVFPT